MNTTRKIVTLFLLAAVAVGVTVATGAIITAMTFAGYTLANLLYDLTPPMAIFVGHCLIYGLVAAYFVVKGVKQGIEQKHGNR